MWQLHLFVYSGSDNTFITAAKEVMVSVMFLVAFVILSLSLATWKVLMGKNFVRLQIGVVLTTHYNVAYIHQGLQGQLSDLLVKIWQKALKLRNYDSYRCGVYA